MNRLARPIVSLIALSTALAAMPALAQEAEGRAFTVDDLARLDRVSDPQVSPDGRTVTYNLRQTDWENNRGVTSLWAVEADGDNAHRLAISDAGANTGRWSSDGRLFFMRGGQVWVSADQGATATQVTNLPLDVGSFRITPDGGSLVISLEVYPACEGDLVCTVSEVEHRANRTETGQVYDRAFVRHWDTWEDGRRNHLFRVDLTPGAAATTATALMPGFDGDTPSVPFGDEGEYAISPDSDTVVFSSRLAGQTEPWSTNFDLYQVPLSGGTLVNLTDANDAWDTGPVFSPDGRTMAYRAMSRPGFEADRWRIMLMDVATGTAREIAADWDRSADSLMWSPDGRTLYATAGDTGTTRLFSIDVRSGRVTPLTTGGHVAGVNLADGGFVYARDGLDGPVNLFYRSARGRDLPRQITNHNAEVMGQIALGDYEQFSFPGWNNETVHGYVVRPHGYQEGQEYPVAFLIHGGPQGSFGDGWSYRWNPQFYAGLGYAVVMIDFHGSTGYGQAFTDAISQHWGDRPLEDLQKGWDYVLAEYDFLDEDRACALGASYGGYMVNWIAGNWNQPWQCLVNHDGVFDTFAMGHETEELWFTEWENGGTPWENPEGYQEFNPANYVQNWRVPMLVVQGDLDFRIPTAQGLATFNALQRRGIPSRLLYFPNENHWVLRAHNSVQWHNTVADWLGRYAPVGAEPID
ncbi:alpha/beta hydrolase family protein [Brevundimonas aveniformis]|uniref:S9 family peptidase n=1 Tax=Brevundimonas aveniformis TaxID=370977 RepID=UPI0004099FA1|nr:S9 family peptidase [Brevundimonas aveniformis]